MTRNWNDLPNELKWMIVDRMDIITRFRLKMCSKSDKCLVETVPFYCDEVSLSSERRYNDEHVLQNMRITTEDSSAVFVSSNNKIIVISSQNKYRSIELSSEEEGREMMKCIFRAFMLPQNVRIGLLNTDSKLNHLFVNPGFKLHVKHIYLSVKGSEEIEELLETFAKQPEKMTIVHPYKDMGKHPVVKSVNCLVVMQGRNIDDEQLINFNATDIAIFGSNITPTGINKLIKKMINEDYPIGSRMRFYDNKNLMIWAEVIFELNSGPIIAKYTNDDEACVNMSPLKQLIITFNNINNIYLLIAKREAVAI